MKIAIIDYGMSNLASISRAFEECRASFFLCDNPSDLKSVTHIVLPGVGAFSEGMKNIRSRKFDKSIKQAVLNDKIPILGVCLGMQLLADFGVEGGSSKGLGLIDGKIDLLSSKKQEERIPHAGWNEIVIKKNSEILKNIPNHSDFYFVHSYYLNTDKKNILATTPYCGEFPSVIKKGNVYGVQFHPEKSQTRGFQIIKNFISIN